MLTSFHTHTHTYCSIVSDARAARRMAEEGCIDEAACDEAPVRRPCERVDGVDTRGQRMEQRAVLSGAFTLGSFDILVSSH